MNTLYDAYLAQTSALKLSALRLRADGPTGPVEAAIALHEAARMEQRAIRVLGTLDPATLLRSSIEQCGLLLDAGDATQVVRVAWPEVLECADALGQEPARPLLARLRPAVEGLYDRLDRLSATFRHLPRLASALRGGGAIPGPEARRELHAYLREFPGDTAGWLNLVVFERMITRDFAEAWKALTVLRRMDPDLEVAQSLELVLGPQMLSPEALRARLRPAMQAVQDQRASHLLAMAVAGGLVHLAVGSATRSADLNAAERALHYGYGRLPGDHPDRPLFRALLAIVDDMQHGRHSSAEVFRRVGLPELARAGSTDPMQTLQNQSWPGAIPALAL